MRSITLLIAFVYVVVLFFYNLIGNVVESKKVTKSMTLLLFKTKT